MHAIRRFRRYTALWSAQVREESRVLQEHDRLVGEKLTRLRREPPADWTIAGAL